MPLLALQRYVPSLVLLLGRINCSPVNSTSLSLPLANTFVHLMFGCGTPSAVQVKVIAASPSRTTWSGALVINDGGSTKEQSRIKESLSLMTCFDHSLFKKRSYDLNATAIT